MVYQYQPVNPLNAFAQGFQMVRGIQDDITQRQQAEAKQQQAMQRQRDLQAAIANLRMNPSPEAIAEFGFLFPEMKEQIDGYYKTLDTAKQRTQTEAAQQIIIAQRSGGDIPAILEQYAVAAENARNPQMAQEFRDAAEMARQDPEAAAETARIRLAFTDPDAYKLVYDNSLYDTATIKELIAEGLEYGTPEFQEALRAKREGDPWVAVPGVGLFMRDQLEAAARSGQAAATPNIPEGAVRMLIQNPNLRGDFDKKYGKGAADRVLGGGGSNATGNFR